MSFVCLSAWKAGIHVLLPSQGGLVSSRETFNWWWEGWGWGWTVYDYTFVELVQLMRVTSDYTVGNMQDRDRRVSFVSLSALKPGSSVPTKIRPPWQTCDRPRWHVILSYQLVTNLLPTHDNPEFPWVMATELRPTYEFIYWQNKLTLNHYCDYGLNSRHETQVEGGIQGERNIKVSCFAVDDVTRNIIVWSESTIAMAGS